MAHRCKVLVIASGFLALACALHAQSLGDVARDNRQQQAQQGDKTQPKAFGNEDLPREGLADDDSAEAPQHSTTAQPLAHQKEAANRTVKAAEFKRQIKAQENVVGELQSRIFRVKSTIRYYDVRVFSNATAYNERQDDKQREVERLQEKLEDEKAKLQSLQDDAKRAGFGNGIYEP